MTYQVTALTNDRAELIAKTMTTNCKMTAETVADAWTGMGFKVVTSEEG